MLEFYGHLIDPKKVEIIFPIELTIPTVIKLQVNGNITTIQVGPDSKEFVDGKFVNADGGEAQNSLTPESLFYTNIMKELYKITPED